MAHVDDATLIRRWQAGDAAALGTLVERWQTPVVRFLTRVVGPDRASDLCQDTFLRVMRAADGYVERGAFSTWLFQVALNVARDQRRRQQRESVTPRPESARGAFVNSPDALTERAELVEAVFAAVADLPAPLREVLALRHDAGLNFEQMGRLLGAPASTLKSRFAAALGRLRERLAERGFPAEEITT